MANKQIKIKDSHLKNNRNNYKNGGVISNVGKYESRLKFVGKCDVTLTIGIISFKLDIWLP